MFRFIAGGWGWKCWYQQKYVIINANTAGDFLRNIFIWRCAECVIILMPKGLTKHTQNIVTACGKRSAFKRLVQRIWFWLLRLNKYSATYDKWIRRLIMFALGPSIVRKFCEICLFSRGQAHNTMDSRNVTWKICLETHLFIVRANKRYIRIEWRAGFEFA